VSYRSILALTATVLLLLPGALTASSGAEGGDGGTVAVLFDFGDGAWRWADVPVPEPANAWCATVAAADQLGIALEYSFSTYGVLLESVDGIEPPDDFSKYWTFWNWSGDGWEFSMAGALDVDVGNGSAVAWRFTGWGDPAPDPNPVTRDPWLSFRGGKGVQGSSASPKLPAGATFWARDLGNGPIDSTMAVADGKVFGITSGIFDWNSFEFTHLPTVFALDASTGEPLWDWEFTGSAGFEISSPAYHAGKVFAALSNGMVVALDADDGTKVWETSVDDEGLSSSPTVTDGLVLTGTKGGGFVALHASNGSVAWETTVAGEVYLAQPTVHDGVVYVGTENGTLHALSMANGSEVWTFEREGRFRGTPLVANGAIYVIRGVYDGFIPKEGYLLALNMDGGSLWEREVGTTGSSPAPVEGLVVVGSTFGLRAFTTSGEAMWTFSGVGAVSSAPAVAGGHIYFITNVNDTGGGLHTSVFSLGPDGSEVWRRELKPYNWALSSVAIADGRIYVATDAGWVYCLGDTAFTADFTWGADYGYVAFNDTSVSVGARIVEWLWNVPGSGEINRTNLNVVFPRSGDYDVELQVIDEFGRVASTIKTINVTLPDLVVGFTFEIDDLSVTFTANNTTEGVGIRYYMWESEGLSTRLPTNKISHVFSKGGTYEVTLTITDEYNREFSNTQTVRLKEEVTDGENGMFNEPMVLYGLVGLTVIIILIGVAYAMMRAKE